VSGFDDSGCLGWVIKPFVWVWRLFQ